MGKQVATTNHGQNFPICQWGFTGEIGSAEPGKKTQDSDFFISTVW